MAEHSVRVCGQSRAPQSSIYAPVSPRGCRTAGSACGLPCHGDRHEEFGDAGEAPELCCSQGAHRGFAGQTGTSPESSLLWEGRHVSKELKPRTFRGLWPAGFTIIPETAKGALCPAVLVPGLWTHSETKKGHLLIHSVPRFPTTALVFKVKHRLHTAPVLTGARASWARTLRGVSEIPQIAGTGHSGGCLPHPAPAAREQGTTTA